MRRSAGRTLALLSISALAAACTSKAKVFDPEGAPTMLEIYDSHLQRAGEPYSVEPTAAVRKDRGGFLGIGRRKAEVIEASAADVAAAGERELMAYAHYEEISSYTRTPDNETDLLFPRHENPTLVMYVHPHLAGAEGMPVPGYTTALTLYERTPFALPGEGVEATVRRPVPTVTDRTDRRQPTSPAMRPQAPMTIQAGMVRP